MPKRKASAWPASILGDPDVLSLDDEGRFVLCKICHVHYAVHGGKKPRPVLMNSNFRTRAWDVHKLRTNSHRVQRDHERARRLQLQQQQAKQQQEKQEKQEKQEEWDREQRVLADAASSSATSSQVVTTTSSRSGDTDVNAVSISRALPVRTAEQEEEDKDEEEEELEDKRRYVEPEEQEEQEHKQEGGSSGAHRRWAEMSMAALQPQESRHPMNRLRVASSPFPEVSSAPAPRFESTPPPPQAPDDRDGEDKAAAAAAVVATLRRPFQLPLEAPVDGRSAMKTAGGEASGGDGSPQISTSQMYATQIEGMARWRHMHDDVSRALRTQPAKRRKPSSDRDRDRVPDGDTEPRESEDSGELSSSSVTASSSGGNATAGSSSSVGVGISTSAGAKPVEAYSRREMRAATALAGTEEMSGNREMVARKLKSLNDQYRARNLRPEDTTAFLDPASASYKTFWGTFRDVMSSRPDSKAPATSTVRETAAATATPTHHHHHHHHYYSGGRRESTNKRRAEDNQLSSSRPATAVAKAAAADGADLTTPGSSANSSDGALLRPQVQGQEHTQTWQVVHDQRLVNAFDRLTGAVSTQLSELLVQETENRREALSGLTQAVVDLGAQQKRSIGQYINLQERHLATMEEILQHKLWQETLEREHEDASDQEMKEEGGEL